MENELRIQFSTRKQLVLKAVMTYISKGNHLYDMDSFSFVGTSHFNIVWENVCQDIFDNQLQKKLNMLDLPEPLHDAYALEDNLMDVIEKPLWTMAGKRAKYTLTPDLISISNKVFFILDAKYYVASIEKDKAPKGQPGIISITKQYLYQLAYQKFVSEHHFVDVKNCFLIPTENDAIENRGNVRMDMFAALHLKDIQVRFLPAKMTYDLYLRGKKMNMDALCL